MIISVYTLKKPIFFRTAQSVTMKTAVGEITVLKNHRPYITFLRPGEIRIVDKNGKTDIISASRGLLEVLPGSRVNIFLR
jgi:F0F1-type ATP synthase epsilon subunit